MEVQFSYVEKGIRRVLTLKLKNLGKLSLPVIKIILLKHTHDNIFIKSRSFPQRAGDRFLTKSRTIKHIYKLLSEDKTKDDANWIAYVAYKGGR